ncbi:unnamed protein product [Prorocentrum cordatum]|uniref:Mannosylglycerate hydrolase MGH1-like glycoside hydrolase domain-containing protein n=1 Tax=Prorocentrum cordatum TaxID=2364126 RepID=A0ABN9VPL2_9DINO|nr:unnamed protein product [Polarella glacialis]
MGCEAFAALWSGLASRQQAARVREHLLDPSKFFGRVPFSTVALDAPEFKPTGYWRGPVWLDQAYFAIRGLQRYGHTEDAERGLQKLLAEVSKDPVPRENYNPVSGAGLGAQFFGWSAASLLMLTTPGREDLTCRPALTTAMPWARAQPGERRRRRALDCAVLPSCRGRAQRAGEGTPLAGASGAPRAPEGRRPRNAGLRGYAGEVRGVRGGAGRRGPLAETGGAHPPGGREGCDRRRSSCRWSRGAGRCVAGRRPPAGNIGRGGVAGRPGARETVRPEAARAAGEAAPGNGLPRRQRQAHRQQVAADGCGVFEEQRHEFARAQARVARRQVGALVVAPLGIPLQPHCPDDHLGPSLRGARSICAVISSHVDSEPHQELAQHLASTFCEMEREDKLLSRPEEIDRVRATLAELRRQLNSSDECFVRLGASHCVSFRVRGSPPALAALPALAAVPVPLVDLAGELCRRTAGQASEAAAAGAPAPPTFAFEPDLALTHLVPYLDGLRSVLDVVDASGADEDTVLICLRHLLHFGLIAMIDAIRPENRYSLTPEFHVAFGRPEVLAEVVEYVTAGRVQEDVQLVQVVQLLYARMDGWSQTLDQFQQENASILQEHGISCRHLVTYGLLRGLLERIGSCDQELTHLEWRELERLRKDTIPRRKNEMVARGMPINQVNKDPQVKAMVSRMNELKDREKLGAEGLCTAAPARSALSAGGGWQLSEPRGWASPRPAPETAAASAAAPLEPSAAPRASGVGLRGFARPRRGPSRASELHGRGLVGGGHGISERKEHVH